MEVAVKVQIEQLPEGFFFATSEDLPGLVAQGRTITEALEIARDVAKKLIEAQRERDGVPTLPTARTGLTIRLSSEPSFQFDRQAAGRHEIWFNRSTKRYTTIPNRSGDMPEGTLSAILCQAGVSLSPIQRLVFHKSGSSAPQFYELQTVRRRANSDRGRGRRGFADPLSRSTTQSSGPPLRLHRE